MTHALAPPPPKRRDHFVVCPAKDDREHEVSEECRFWKHGDQGYNCALHWFWQIESDPRMWAPEVYESVSWPVSIVRIVRCKEFRSLKEYGKRRSVYPTAEQLAYLHFDFKVEVRIRSLGYFTNRLRRAAKPPEMRAKSDPGEPLGSDLWAFCLYITFSDFPKGARWPTEPTAVWGDALRAYVAQVSISKLLPKDMGSTLTLREGNQCW